MPKRCQAYTSNRKRCKRNAVLTGKFVNKLILGYGPKEDNKACCNLCWQHLKIAILYGVYNVVIPIVKKEYDGNDKCILNPADCWIWDPDNPQKIQNLY